MRTNEGPSFSQPSACCAGILVYQVFERNSIKFLLLQSSRGNHLWTPPKGHVERGESLKCAAIRECHEEAGLKLNSDFCLLHPDFRSTVCTSNDENSKLKNVTYFLARLKPDANVQLSNSHQCYKWCTVKEIAESVKHPQILDAVNAAVKYLLASAPQPPSAICQRTFVARNSNGVRV